MEYPKIQSLWKRELNTKKLIEDNYSEEEFGTIKLWSVTEKIDGTNVRVEYKNGNVQFMGRTKDAQMPPHLLNYLQLAFHPACLHKEFVKTEDENYPHVIIFGEGYGPKIQAVGGNYRKEVGFIIFDIWVGGWWLKQQDVRTISTALGIDTVPDLGTMSEPEIVDFVKGKPQSRCSLYPQMMEGVVCRSEPLVLLRNGKPVMWKLKCKDFS